MLTSLRSQATTVVVAGATALIVAGAPALARSASHLARAGIDAESVHGFHAVGCRAAPATARASSSPRARTPAACRTTSSRRRPTQRSSTD